MKVQILTPEQNVFDGNAESVQFPGVDGSFEILNNHAPLISALIEGQIKLTSGKDTKRFLIKSGFVEVLNNNVVVLIEGATTKE